MTVIGEHVAQLSLALPDQPEQWVACLDLQLLDGEVHVAAIHIQPQEPQRLDGATNKVLRNLRLPDVEQAVEAALRQADGRSVGWLRAIEATRKRAGRAGLSHQTWAMVAARRVVAEALAPGQAINYMTQEWPSMFTSPSSASAKVNKAIRRGMLERTPHGLQLTPAALQYVTAEVTG